jgi:hypothetical protein
VPEATTGPPEEPERIVMKSEETLLAKRSVCPFTAPFIVEYSPAKEQVEIVTDAPVGLMVAEPNELVFKQGPGGAEQEVH